MTRRWGNSRLCACAVPEQPITSCAASDGDHVVVMYSSPEAVFSLIASLSSSLNELPYLLVAYRFQACELTNWLEVDDIICRILQACWMGAIVQSLIQSAYSG